jgi:hypothetical protein
MHLDLGQDRTILAFASCPVEMVAILLGNALAIVQTRYMPGCSHDTPRLMHR